MEENNQSPVEKQQKNTDSVFNLLTIIIMLGILAVLIFTAIIFSNPSSSLNPFAPPTLPPQIVLPTATTTPRRIADTWTPTFAPEATETATLTPATETPTPSSTFGLPTALVIGSVSPSATVDSEFSFVTQADPVAIDASIFNPGRTCKWTGIAGQVVDLQSRPVIGITVHLKGFFGGKTVDVITLSGLYKQYGESGFEFELGTQPVDTYNLLKVRLEDQAGLPLSDFVSIDTFSDCAKNLIVVNFKQVK
jgi:hypothetical protein